MGSFLFEILDFVVLALFVMGLVRRIGSLFGKPSVHVRTMGGPPPRPSAAAAHSGEMVRDPVCGMFVSTELTQKLRLGGDTIHFCSRECMEKYREEAKHAAS
jgi:YHS domain-containing protein